MSVYVQQYNCFRTQQSGTVEVGGKINLHEMIISEGGTWGRNEVATSHNCLFPDFHMSEVEELFSGNDTCSWH